MYLLSAGIFNSPQFNTGFIKQLPGLNTEIGHSLSKTSFKVYCQPTSYFLACGWEKDSEIHSSHNFKLSGTDWSQGDRLFVPHICFLAFLAACCCLFPAMCEVLLIPVALRMFGYKWLWCIWSTGAQKFWGDERRKNTEVMTYFVGWITLQYTKAHSSAEGRVTYYSFWACISIELV